VAPSYLPNDEARVLEQGASLKVQVGPSGLYVLHFNKGCVSHTEALPFYIKKVS